MKLDADIICLQETKMEKEQMEEKDREMPDYVSYWNSSKKRKGYSGTAIYIKNELAKTIVNVQYGLTGDRAEEFNNEGRLITIEFKDFAICNGYFPNGGRDHKRVSFKLGYYETFMSHIESVRKRQSNVLWMGDVNTAHTEIDLTHPKTNHNTTGFLPEEREWIDEMVAIGYIDTFRALNPSKIEVYTWWHMMTRARERNVGWRIDYVFASEELMPRVTHATIHSSILGSDHCPVSVDVSI
jgi:exodeoxyribonuclease-3